MRQELEEHNRAYESSKFYMGENSLNDTLKSLSSSVSMGKVKKYNDKVIVRTLINRL